MLPITSPTYINAAVWIFTTHARCFYLVNAERPMQQAYQHNTADQLASTRLKCGLILRMKLHFLEALQARSPVHTTRTVYSATQH